jgi:hypothetical protein
MKVSIVPEIIKQNSIKFFDERDVEISLCENSNINYIIPFVQPRLIINTFAKKTTKPSELVFIDIEELKKLGFFITVINTSHGWYARQKVIYKIESDQHRTPGSKKMTYIPGSHKIQKDISNKRIRLVGANAGYPHYTADYGGAGPWINL